MILSRRQQAVRHGAGWVKVMVLISVNWIGKGCRVFAFFFNFTIASGGVGRLNPFWVG